MDELIAIFQARMIKLYWFQHLKCEDLLLLFFYDTRLNIFGFWTVGRTKQAAEYNKFALREIVFSFCSSPPAADAVCTGPGGSSSCVSPWLWSW